MRPHTKLPCEKLISASFEKSSDSIDVDLHRITEVRQYDALELNLVFYPYNKDVHADHYVISPFEEYVKDIAKHWRSAYEPIRSKGKEIFGILVGLVTFLFVLKYTHSDVITMESLIGIFVSYFIGKDLWDDISSTLESMTRRWRLRYREDDYRYHMDKNSTLLTFNSFARRKQLHGDVIYPDLMDFVIRSRSSTIRMKFGPENFKGVTSEKARLFTIDPQKKAALHKDGHLIGLKATFGKRFFGIWKNVDVYQSADNGKLGCVDKDGNWLKDTAFTRTHLTLGRLRWTISTGYIQKVRIIC